MAKYQKHKQWIYAAYKGDKFLCEGTRDEICKELNIKLKTFQYYRTNYYRKYRNTKSNNRVIIIRVDGEEKIWNE